MAARLHAVLAPLTLALALTSSAVAQSGHTATNHAGTTPATRHTFVASPGQAEIVEERGFAPPPPLAVGANLPGRLWSYPDNGEDWVGRAVTIGNDGTQVFAEFDNGAHRASLFSSFDVAPAQPVWSDPTASSSMNVKVHGCDAIGPFVSCRQIPTAPNGPRHVDVAAYSSSSAAPSWTYRFPLTTYGQARAMVSADGNRIVAGMLHQSTATLHVAVFDNGSSVPTSYWTRQIGLQMQAFVLSEDGSSVYAASTTGGYICDAATGFVRLQILLMQSFAAQDISGDGGILAIGYFNGVDVWERQAGGNYIRTWQGNWPGAIVCHQLDISADGSLLVLGFGYFDQNLGVRIEAIDLRTKNTTMVDEAFGAGSLQNIVSKVACAANGDRFAVGLWGDEAGLVPELRLYRRGQNAPVATYDYPGSIYDVAISADGDRVVAGSKAVHANLLSGGGTVDLYSLGVEDFVASTTPRLGTRVTFELWGASNSPARLLMAPEPAKTPLLFPPYGVLYLNRTMLSILPMPATDAQGYTFRQYQLPSNPAMIGATLWFQGLTTQPRRFTQDYVQLTILP